MHRQQVKQQELTVTKNQFKIEMLNNALLILICLAIMYALNTIEMLLKAMEMAK